MDISKYQEDAKIFLQSKSKGKVLLEEYIPFCNYLLYIDPDIILEVTNKLKNNIVEYATNNSLIYKDFHKDKIYSRKDLDNHKSWFVEDLKEENQIFNTSGSTSGESFSYGVWNKHIRFLEDESHYGMILDEFNIRKKNPKILMLKKLGYNPNHKEFLHIQEGDSPYTLHTHKSIDSVRYFVNFENYVTNSDVWFEELLENIKSYVPFDIIMITGPIMNLLGSYLNRNNIDIKLGDLMSQTGEFMRANDKRIMLEKQYVNNVCDHMRCWDGGATFFTCKYNTYHLLDNLTIVTQGADNKMISSDYFNLSSPFLNYYNGDLCEIHDEYKKCKCGRYYRNFKMLENRPFALKGKSKLTKIKEQINQLEFKNELNQIQFDNLSVRISCSRELCSVEKDILQNILKEYQIFWK
jgi:hypothetical protein